MNKKLAIFLFSIGLGITGAAMAAPVDCKAECRGGMSECVDVSGGLSHLCFVNFDICVNECRAR
ncbi:hypothetical protein [Janthinobacterium sp.]|uniref:hypothetical protein n=1 Tax=Janthinobacterium sp. TaxID=1871054 RepID=UPI002585C660|nr:hypothetical protein [Janthinobacterium sp.]MCX7292494.1 hypothetical protein [Janthinobacterium sp.]